MTARMYKRLAVCMAIALGFSLLLSVAFHFNFLSSLQSQSTDVLFKVRPPSNLNQFAQRVAIIAMDDRSIEKLGYWVGWERSYYTRVIQYLAEARARVVALDVSFEQDRPGDDQLAKTISEAGMVVQPVAGSPNLPEPARAGEVIRFKGLIQPQPELAAASAALGHANVLPDGDGAVRTSALLIQVDQRDYPSLALAAVGQYLRRPQLLDAPPSIPHLRALGRAVPVDPFYRMKVNYVGGPSLPDVPSTFTTVSFVDVLEGRVDPALFRDRIVFVGLLGATGFADDYWVPTSEAGTGKMAGVEIHANAAVTILSGSFLAPQEEIGTIIAVLLLSVACAALAVALPTLLAAVGAFGLALAYMLLAFTMFDRGTMLNVIYPQLGIALSFIGVIVYRVVFEEAERRATLKAMSQYLSPAVMHEVMKDPGKLGLGGQKREMTVLFSDIRGFTSVSEKLDPQQLVHLLNEYLTAMTEVVFKYGGVLDKYMGDAIMAFWGAPVSQPDHAARACDTALGMMEELRILQARWEREGVPRLDIGIGLNTGMMSVGNMGSFKRFDYTVMGDAVNLGSRLEGLNKEYATNIVISQYSWDQVRDAGFLARYLDLVAVKGKSEPVAIYELLGRGEIQDPQRVEMLRLYEAGVELYQQRQWEAAQEAFAKALELDPRDGPAAVYLERSRQLSATPPPEDWNGVYVMKHK